VVVLTRLHKPVPHLVYAKRIVVRRILKYLESIEQGPHNGVCNVYFGHTHRRLSNYYYRGLRFHNGGAPIKGVKFRILEARR
jgi:UDP-2,3-diacylglucosamine hydrolase